MPLHSSLNRNRFKDKIMEQFKVLQRPLRVLKDARRCNIGPLYIGTPGDTIFVAAGMLVTGILLARIFEGDI
ncbi:hypothetical protein E0H38_32320 [Rhizobium leguminosarum bv. viciae]|nr:hypothetical protein E0H38_32320 [Rhizobium leguminosarum bv. viciae]